MSDTEESPTPGPSQPESTIGVVPVPTNPFKGQATFRTKEIGDYFFSELQQQHAAFNDFKSQTGSQINSIQSTINRLTAFIEQSLGQFNAPKSQAPSQANSSENDDASEEGEESLSGTDFEPPTVSGNRPPRRQSVESQFPKTRVTTHTAHTQRHIASDIHIHQLREDPEPTIRIGPSRREMEDARTDPEHDVKEHIPSPTPLSEGSGRLPGQRLPCFFGRDDENVLSWLQKIDLALEAARVHEKSKLANVAPLIRGDADSWFYWFMQQYPNGTPTYAQFKVAIIQKYERSDV
jgi:hypothetical protein